ncbi:hypothetical protein PAL_GLEAN10012211 [Pteropus alecto]|uniref:Uncharacterized protein n=1 Tax=Pteropus alecto TaxID=9402 RepID=L5KC81_PTEAL|nr:hypothetical protein PAL_GLEAN10012211 [Pteropus alecto]
MRAKVRRRVSGRGWWTRTRRIEGTRSPVPSRPGHWSLPKQTRKPESPSGIPTVLSLRPQMCVSSPMFNPSLCRMLLEGVVSMSLVQSLTHKAASALQVLRPIGVPAAAWLSSGCSRLMPRIVQLCYPAIFSLGNGGLWDQAVRAQGWTCFTGDFCSATGHRLGRDRLKGILLWHLRVISLDNSPP